MEGFFKYPWNVIYVFYQVAVFYKRLHCPCDIRFLENVAADVVVEAGDVVLTSGLGGSYQRGLLIGSVVKVEGRPGDATRTIVVSPNDITHGYEDVIVVFEASGDTGSSTGSDNSQGSDNDSSEGSEG